MNLIKSTPIFLIVFLFSCRPSSEELEARKIADNTVVADSIAKVQYEQQRQADQIDHSNPSLAKDFNFDFKGPADKKLIKTAEIKFEVGNVWKTTEKIEDLVSKFNGYVTYSNLENSIENSSSINISRDSILISREIRVINEIKLRVPNVKLDSFVRDLKQFVLFLDYRRFLVDDVTFQSASIDRKGERYKNYEKRQSSHIDSRNGKVKDVTEAEDNLLEHQLQADEIALKSKELEDKLKYCNIDLYIYQKPVIVKEVKADFRYVSSSKPNFFVRLIDSIVRGFSILEEIVLFLFSIWGVLLIGAGAFIGFRLLLRVINKKE